MFEALKNKWNDDVNAVFLSVVLTIAVCLQVLIAVAAVFSFIPIKLDSSLDQVLPQVVALFRPEREMAFYQFFVILTIIVQIAVTVIFKDRLRDQNFINSLKQFLIVEYIWIGLLLFAVFKILVYKEPAWAKILFFVFLGLSVVSKVFWLEVKAAAVKAYRFLIDKSGSVWFVRVSDGLCVLAVVLFIWIPDPKAGLGRILAADRFYHWDTFLMAPLQAQANGAVLNVDIFSPMGVVATVFVGTLARWTGGLDNAHVLGVLLMMTIVYCAAGYGLLRMMFRRVMLAAFGVLLLVKLHLFHVSATPLIWIFPELTVLRTFFDLALVFGLWQHSQSRRFFYVIGAALACGWSIAYMPDNGIYQTLALYGYLLAVALIPQSDDKVFIFPRDLRKVFLAALIPWVTALLVMAVFAKASMFTAGFWNSHSGFLNGFFQGLGNVPIYEGLKGRHFFAMAMGLLIPVFFILTAMVVSFAVYIKEAAVRRLWIVGVCFYGLACHWFYINRSEPSVYYVHALPLVIVICFWLSVVSELWNEESRRRFLSVLLVITLGGLLTNNLFINYPNALNLSGHDWSGEKKLFDDQLSFGRDTQLIERLTKSADPVVIISSFSTKMLADIARRPYFYYAPIVVSSLPSANEFRGTVLFDRDRMTKTLGQLQSQQPALVFVEKKFYTMSLPKEYEAYLQSWLLLRNYLAGHYDAAGEGQYLLVLKRKP